MVRKRENIQWAAVVWTKMPCWCQRRMDRLVRDDRKETVTQITTRYNQGMQNTISEHTTHRTLKQMDSSSRRPHRVPLLSDKNRKRSLQFTYNYGVGDIFLAHFGPLTTNWASFKRLSIVADHVHPFMTTVYPSSDATSSRIMHHDTKLKSSQTGFLNMTMSSLYSNGLHSHQISIQ